MKNFNVALCKVFDEKPKKLPKGTWYIEPKYDGLRCLVFIDSSGQITFKSRNNKPIYNIEIIKEQLRQLKLTNRVLDGELQGDDWNQTISVLHTQTEHPERNSIKLYLFDMVPLKHWNTNAPIGPYYVRRQALKNFPSSEHIKIIESKLVTDFNKSEWLYKSYLTQGFEGVILKEGNQPYPYKRSKYWLKWKPVRTYDIKIEGVIEGTGKHKGRLGAFVCRFKKRKLKVGSGLTDIQREELWAIKEKLVGKTLEVKCQEVTRDGSLRFPTFLRLRKDK